MISSYFLLPFPDTFSHGLGGKDEIASPRANESLSLHNNKHFHRIGPDVMSDGMEAGAKFEGGEKRGLESELA